MKLSERIKEYPRHLIVPAVWCGITDVLSLNSDKNIVHKRLRVPAYRRYCQMLSDWVYEQRRNLFDKADTLSLGSPDENPPIWIMWLQGMDKAPELVRMCYESVKRHANGHPIRIVTEENISSYVELPSWIWDKYSNGILSRTNFSDITRLALLAEYGGLWIDSTVFVNKDIDEEVFSFPFFSTRRLPEDDVFYRYPKPEWAVFIFGVWKDSFIMKTCRDVLYEHFREHNSFPTYFMIDYVFAALRDHSRKFRECIEMVPVNNLRVTHLMCIINDEYNPDVFDDYLNDKDYFAKLSNRKKVQKTTASGNLTYYGELCRRMLSTDE